MTLLHQAAQKAVEALKAAQRAINSMKVEAETAAVGGDEQMLQEACETISAEGLEADMELRAAIAALFALQHQEVPREPVATLRVTLEYDDEDGPLEIVCHGTELNMRRLDARLKFLHRLEKQSNDCAASPSTTRQQEVGSDGKLWCVNVWGPDDIYAMPNRAAALERANSMNIEFGSIPWHELDPIMLAVVIEWPHAPESHAEDLRRYAAAPSTPEKAGGVSDGVGAHGEGQQP